MSIKRNIIYPLSLSLSLAFSNSIKKDVHLQKMKIVGVQNFSYLIGFMKIYFKKRTKKSTRIFSFENWEKAFINVSRNSSGSISDIDLFSFSFTKLTYC